MKRAALSVLLPVLVLSPGVAVHAQPPPVEPGEPPPTAEPEPPPAAVPFASAAPAQVQPGDPEPEVCAGGRACQRGPSCDRSSSCEHDAWCARGSCYAGRERRFALGAAKGPIDLDEAGEGRQGSLIGRIG